MGDTATTEPVYEELVDPEVQPSKISSDYCELGEAEKPEPCTGQDDSCNGGYLTPRSFHNQGYDEHSDEVYYENDLKDNKVAYFKVVYT